MMATYQLESVSLVGFGELTFGSVRSTDEADGLG